MENKQDGYIPYKATAKEITEADNSLVILLESLHPNITQEQIIIFKHWLANKILEGIEIGLALGDENPLKYSDYYLMGVSDGRNL